MTTKKKRSWSMWALFDELDEITNVDYEKEDLELIAKDMFEEEYKIKKVKVTEL